MPTPYDYPVGEKMAVEWALADPVLSGPTLVPDRVATRFRPNLFVGDAAQQPDPAPTLPFLRVFQYFEDSPFGPSSPTIRCYLQWDAAASRPGGSPDYGPASAVISALKQQLRLARSVSLTEGFLFRVELGSSRRLDDNEPGWGWYMLQTVWTIRKV